MEKQKLIYVESKAQFSPSEVSDKAIVFIKDTKEIWTHGVYFSCSGTWATPITLNLTGDTTGSVSIDGSGNASIATTTRYLSGMSSSSSDCNSAATTQPGNVTYYPCVLNSATNKFPTSNNANGILSLNVHDYSYTHQLGFSSNGNIYHRRRNGGTWETTWKTILSSTNYTNFPHTFASLTNKPTTLSGYGITDCIPIISGGLVTTDTDLSTLGMTTSGAKLSVGHTTDTKFPGWLTDYSNLLVFRSTSDLYSGIATDTFGRYVTFIGGRNAETSTNNIPNWWFRIKGASGTTYDLNSIQNNINNLDSNYLRKSGGTMTGILTLTTGSAYINDTASGYSIYGSLEASNTSIGTSGLATIFSGAPTLNMVLRTSGDNLYHYNHSKSARYLILDTNNYSSYALPLSGGTMTGALNFANNTWNKVGDDAYMGDCNVQGMIGIKGSNAATPGFAMYNNSGTLLGKLYASGTSLYWSDAKILTASGTSKQFVMGDGSLYSDTVSYTTWDKTTTSGIAWFPIADVTDSDQGTALFIVRAYANSSIIFTVTKGYDNGNINVLAGGGNFNNSYAYIKGVRQVGSVVEIGLNAAATYVSVVIRVLQPTFTYSLRSSLVESTNTATPYVQYDINSGGNRNFGIISSKFTGNLIGNADTASNISTVNPILAQPFENNTIQVVSNPQGALAEQQGTAAAITHALRFNWYNTAYEIGNVRGGASNSLGFGITYGNNNLCLLVKTNGTYSPYGFIGDLTGNAATANKWATARTITLTGDVTGSVSLDGSSNVTLTTTTSGTGTTSFLKCPDKRNSYPAEIVTSGGNIGAAFISTSTLGLSEGYYCDTLILRGYATHTAGYENALFFSKQNSSVYHSRYAFGSTTTWGTLHKFLDSNNYSSYALPLSGGTMTGKLTMQANSLDKLPQIQRTDGAYISGIRFQNTLGYLGAIGMNVVNGSLYILDTANTTYTILDSRNYNNYSPTLAGTGASGTWAINISGVAASASKVANALTIQLNGGTTAGTNKFVYDGSSAYTINITPAAIGASATSHTHSYLPLSGGTLGNSTASFTELFIKSSTANMRLMAYSDSTNYIQSGNSDFSGNATLKITGYNSNTGSNLYLNFANIYCRGDNYTNIDSGNYSSYALPLSGGTLTGTLTSRDIRPSANVSYSLGTSSYYYNYVYAKYFKKNGSSDSYVLLGGGGHKAVSDFTMKEQKTTTSISGNTDQWSIILEQSYPADHWYDVVNTFLVEGMQFGSGFLSFYAYWQTTSSAFKDYITEVYFNGTMRGETTAAFGGSNRDINDYLRIYIDKTNYKLLVYANHYNGKTVRIKRINYNEIDTTGFPNGGILVEHFNDKGTIVSLPTESSTMTRVLIKTHYNHDRTIKTSKSIYASSFYENSDIRLKENIRGIDQSDLTKQVDLVQFNFKDSDTKKYGVIAQQLEQVGLQNLVYENDGKKAVDYISLLVLEIQRLRNEIGELKQEIHKKS